VPVDYDSAGLIRDDDLYDTLVRPIVQGVTMVSLMDCCHSGTVLDLPNKYDLGGKSKGCRCSYHLYCLINLSLIAVIVVLSLFLTGHLEI
jgi:hypothetical protein